MIRPLLASLAVAFCASSAWSLLPAKAANSADAIVLHVNPDKGRANGDGSSRRPLPSISAALAKLDYPQTKLVTIKLSAGSHDTTGGVNMSEGRLELSHPMGPGVAVVLEGADGDEPTVLDWPQDRCMVSVQDGRWVFQNLQLGSFSKKQRRGIVSRGNGRVTIQDVRFRLRSRSDAALWAVDGGRILLSGKIAINEHLHDEAEEETFSCIQATDHGLIEFIGRKGSTLELGNGNLSTRRYGCIRLGCESARITCWTRSNNLIVHNSGRIDLHNTPTHLVAHDPKNTPIGLEDDGHILAEDTHILIEGKNDSAIALQKRSALFCNDIELKGEFEYALWASSGSTFVGRFLTDIGKLEATTGASIHLEKLHGKVKDMRVKSGGVITSPEGIAR